jgi:5'-AMP-activated protein kinase, catalytic alpha subunit
VKQGTHILTNEKVAIKILDKKIIEQENDGERVNREITILRKVRHPNIVQLFEVRF